MKGKTNFTITITNFENGSFTGTVIDNIETGGMNGIGIIKGTISHNIISFTKEMPYQTSIGLSKRVSVSNNKKHPIITYKGLLEPESSQAKGSWEISILFFFKQKGKWVIKKLNY